MAKQSLNIVVAFIAILILPMENLFSQAIESYCITAGYRYSSFSETAGFKKIPDYESCCDRDFTSDGEGNGGFVSANANLSDFWKLSFEIGYTKHVSQLNAYEDEVINVGKDDFLGKFNHHIKVNFDEIRLLPSISYNSTDNLFLRATAGLVVIASNSFSGYEKIVYPTDSGVFKDTGTRIRNEKQGTISNMNTLIPVIGGGIDYYLQASHQGRFGFVASADLFLYLGSFLDNADWNCYTLQFGIGVYYKL